jgi:flagellar assembly factor FliW
MKITTKYFGEVEIQKEDVTTFEQGIPGFSDESEFVFLPLDETDFVIMQSVLTPSLALVTTSPFNFFKDYEIKLSDGVINQLQIEKEADVTLFVILNVKEPFSDSTANLVAPVIINEKKKLGKQAILENSPYKTRQSLFDVGGGKKEVASHARSKA